MERKEYREKKKYFMRYRENRETVKRIKGKAIELDQKICKTKSPNYTGMPKGGTAMSMEEIIAEKTELEERIGRLEAKGRLIKKELLTSIDTMDNSRQAAVLEAFFIDCMELSEIAAEKKYSTRQVERLYKEGLNSITFSVN